MVLGRKEGGGSTEPVHHGYPSSATLPTTPYHALYVLPDSSLPRPLELPLVLGGRGPGLTSNAVPVSVPLTCTYPHRPFVSFLFILLLQTVPISGLNPRFHYLPFPRDLLDLWFCAPAFCQEEGTYSLDTALTPPPT